MNVKELLSAAADYVEAHGLNKGTYYNKETGCVCAYGAMTAAVSGGVQRDYSWYDDDTPYTYEHKKLVDQAALLLATHLPNPNGYPVVAERPGAHTNEFDVVTEYSDDSVTTAADVARKMREAANADR